MTGNEYQIAALRTASKDKDSRNLVNCALGLTGEAGEFADMVKKKVFHGHTLDKEKAIKEVSDVLWYCAVASYVLGYTLDEVMQINIDKLMVRYPNGFDTAHSIARIDEKQ